MTEPVDSSSREEPRLLPAVFDVPTDRPRLLIVDDDRSNLDVLISVLKPYRLSVARDGATALKIASSSAPPDLILLDVMMPGMDGYEVARRLRADDRTRDLPIIFLTSLDRVQDEVRAFENGAVDYITKPVVPEVVRARVGTHLELREQRRRLAREHERADGLLRNVLPAKIIERLKTCGRADPELFPAVSVVFTDIVEFTTIASRLAAPDLIRELNDLFTSFDAACGALGVERIKTIGDAYLAVAGIPEAVPDHAERAVRLALSLVRIAEERNARIAAGGPGTPFKIRAGAHTGPAVGAVVGTSKFIYDVFGDTVNTASRMECSSCPMRVNVSEATWQLTRDRFAFEARPLCNVKGKGEMRMYFAIGEH